MSGSSTAPSQWPRAESRAALAVEAQPSLRPDSRFVRPDTSPMVGLHVWLTIQASAASDRFATQRAVHLTARVHSSSVANAHALRDCARVFARQLHAQVRQPRRYRCVAMHKSNPLWEGTGHPDDVAIQISNHEVAMSPRAVGWRLDHTHAHRLDMLKQSVDGLVEPELRLHSSA